MVFPFLLEKKKKRIKHLLFEFFWQIKIVFPFLLEKRRKGYDIWCLIFSESIALLCLETLKCCCIWIFFSVHMICPCNSMSWVHWPFNISFGRAGVVLTVHCKPLFLGSDANTTHPLRFLHTGINFHVSIVLSSSCESVLGPYLCYIGVVSVM